MCQPNGLECCVPPKLGLAWGLVVSLVRTRLGAKEIGKSGVKLNLVPMPGPLQAGLSPPEMVAYASGGELRVAAEGGAHKPPLAAPRGGVEEAKGNRSLRERTLRCGSASDGKRAGLNKWLARLAAGELS